MSPKATRLPEQAGCVRGVGEHGERNVQRAPRARRAVPRIRERFRVEPRLDAYRTIRRRARTTERRAAAPIGEMLAQEPARRERMLVADDGGLHAHRGSSLRRPAVAELAILARTEREARIERSCRVKLLARDGDVVRREEASAVAAVEV